MLRKRAGIRLMCLRVGDRGPIDPLDLTRDQFDKAEPALRQVLRQVTLLNVSERLRAPGPLAWSNVNEQSFQEALRGPLSSSSGEPLFDLPGRWGMRIGPVLARALKLWVSRLALPVQEERAMALTLENAYVLGWLKAFWGFYCAYQRVASQFLRARQAKKGIALARASARRLLRLWAEGSAKAPALGQIVLSQPPLGYPYNVEGLPTLRLEAGDHAVKWALILALMAEDAQAARLLAESWRLRPGRPSSASLFAAFKRAELVVMDNGLHVRIDEVLSRLSIPKAERPPS